MASIKGKNTKQERLVFRFLRENGVYFQRHYSKVIGCPDIALPSKKKAVFIDGDFWHGWELIHEKRIFPEYWREKIMRNMDRDVRNRRTLRRKGWSVLRVWEHQLKADEDKALKKILIFLKGK